MITRLLYFSKWRLCEGLLMSWRQLSMDDFLWCSDVVNHLLLEWVEGILGSSSTSTEVPSVLQVWIKSGTKKPILITNLSLKLSTQCHCWPEERGKNLHYTQFPLHTMKKLSAHTAYTLIRNSDFFWEYCQQILLTNLLEQTFSWKQLFMHKCCGYV